MKEMNGIEACLGGSSPMDSVGAAREASPVASAMGRVLGSIIGRATRQRMESTLKSAEKRVAKSAMAALVLSGWVTAGLMMNGQATAAEHEQAGPAPENWTPSTLREPLDSFPVGDATQGQTLNQTLFCSSCHGNAGVAPSMNWPHLAGQRVDYTVKVMLDYRSGLRMEDLRGQLMHDVAVMLDDQQIADLAAYYASLPAPSEDLTPRPQVALNQADLPAERLVRKGDPTRLITPCASCHGAEGEGGRREAPELAGQNPLYFAKTMRDYHQGLRANDGKKTMRAFAYRLTPNEIADLAVYYADLPVGD